ncbi:SusC/RagA family TonB-linked outer membrane protein [Mucilaginibacter pedocola]|uniref:SusC/RagA family TonB-linked outer membrane protein n=1 Tax=Mucilaginibacter pedocola TaxID=1792845 RepID=A0A1S9PFS1_9SPHI|nr:TonB-dependent receptor [Mucilaginibacter pedocola]OOQ59792.1 SusC/RagA family TonB-linked outer membrane protein [Mucilaginibacter pedocola]
MQFKLKFLACIALLFCLVSSAYAQSLRITGKVTQKSDGQGVPGATVALKGTTIGTVTDINGNYTLTLNQNTSATLVVSFIGMVTVERTVSATGVQNFVLDDASKALEEVVVVGYGTQKVTNISGAISVVKASDIKKLNAVRTEEALQGQVSGVTVVQSGSPGAKPTVLVRGIPSFSGNDPTVVVDGSIQSLDDLNSINPNDIESINVLKDPATTAIYGLKGGNGVIVVTTKAGRPNQKTEFSINSNYGVQDVSRRMGVLNASEYGAMVNEGSVAAGGNIIFPDLSILGTGTDWQKEIFHTAPMQSHNLSARGGSEKMSYFLSAGYLSQGGIVGGYDKSHFNRGTFTANLTYDLTPKLKFIMNTTGVLLNNKGVAENSFNSIIGNALNFDPTVPVYNTDPSVNTKYGYSNLLLSEIFNPINRLDNTFNTNTGSKIYGKFEAQYTVIKGLKLNSRFGYTKYDDRSKSFTPLMFYGPLNVENSQDAAGNQITGRHNSVNQSKSSNFNYTWENFANYNFSVAKDHNFETVVGFSMAKISGNGMNVGRQDVPFNSWEFADYSAATGTNTADNPNAQTGGAYQYFRRNLSYFGRVNYDYKNKYLASFSARRDGSYAFGVNNKFGNFYAGSLGWVVTQEDFFKPAFIDYLKIRGSYGVTGNENVSPQYNKIATGGPDYGSMANSNGYNFGNVFYTGSTLASLRNDDLAWEKQKQGNFGFDLTMAHNKISISADYYQKRVSGLLFTPTAPLVMGTIPVPVYNIGSTKSSGFDITVSYNERIGGFKLNNSFNVTTIKNMVRATNSDGTARILGGGFFNGQSQTVTVFEKGQTPAYFYGYKTAGLFQNAAEIAAAPTQAGAQPGDIRFVDVNGDGVITAADQTKIGDPFPNVTLGWNLGMSYKGFDFSALTYASLGGDIYRAYERNANFSNKYRGVLARWTGEGTTNDARYPRYSFLDPNSNIRVSDRYVEDGSFVKVKNIQLGYTFSKAMLKNVFKSVRIYAQVKNAFTFTKYTGYDPEISGGSNLLETGVDRGAYPQARIYSVGLDINL